MHWINRKFLVSILTYFFLIKYSFYHLVGCVIIHKDSKILASGQNEPVRLKNATRHAEMCALDSLFAQYDLPTAQKVRDIFSSLFSFHRSII